MLTLDQAHDQILTKIRSGEILTSITQLKTGDLIMSRRGFLFKVGERTKNTFTIHGRVFSKRKGTWTRFVDRQDTLTFWDMAREDFWKVEMAEAVFLVHLMRQRRNNWRSFCPVNKK